MLRVCRHPQKRFAYGQECVSRGGSDARAAIEKPACQHVNKCDRGHVHDDKTDMDAGNRLSEQSHNQGVGRVDAGEFHIVGLQVWRNTVKHELAHVSIFAFVSLERHVEDANANDGDCQRYDRDSQPGPTAADVDVFYFCFRRWRFVT